MAVVRKFSFDQVFDLQDESVLDEPENEAPPPEPTFTRKDLAAARDQGFAEGHEAGAAEAQAAIENAAATALAQIGESLASLCPVVSETALRCRQESIGIARAVARKMVEQTVGDSAQTMVEAVITDILPRIIDEPRVVIRVSDELLDPLQQRLPAVAEGCGFPGSLILLAEHDLGRPDCRIEWADGGAEYDSEKLWNEIDDIIDRYRAEIGATGGAGHGAIKTGDAGQTNSEEHADG